MPSAVNEKSVADLTAELKSSSHVVVTDYQGLTTEELNDLRAKLRPFGTKYKIIKNRLAKIALQNVGWTGLEASLKGSTAIAFKGQDFAGISKILFKFSEEHKNLKVRSGHAFGNVIDGVSIKAVASLPSREVLLATLLTRLQTPLQTLASTLNEPLRSIHGALSALARKKEATPAA